MFSRLSVSCFDILSFFFHAAIATNEGGNFPGFCSFVGGVGVLIISLLGLVFSDCTTRYLDDAEYKKVSPHHQLWIDGERTGVFVASLIKFLRYEIEVCLRVRAGGERKITRHLVVCRVLYILVGVFCFYEFSRL